MANNPMKKGNPYMGTVTETYKPDGSRQANLKGPDGASMQVNQGADGNVAVTKTETVDFSKVMPFTSLQPAAAAMDQIFGTRMAQSMPSQSAMVQNYRMLQGKEADPLADLRRQALEQQIANRKENMALRKRGLDIQEGAAKERLRVSEENKALRKGLQLEKKVKDYSTWVDKNQISEINDTISHIQDITQSHKDLPGFGQTALAPNWMISKEGEDLRSQVQNLFNLTLKMRSGAAVTDQEMRRLYKEFQDGKWRDDDALRRGLQQYLSRVKEKVRNTNAGTDPDALAVYQSGERGGRDFLGELEGVNFKFGGGQQMAEGWSPEEEAELAALEELEKAATAGK
jgi:hypothetical protein